ncbi:PAS domain-containing protein [Patescibacteria group bacterium]|nr:PAS domain-containing protein [Patescibacteria group bacterium]MBU1673919.1 PAS domain-containing protein [Patescibacteria group bacterium]MBU1963913.1 PAS domain-containing protein [Patescibacteria group bacterium]
MPKKSEKQPEQKVDFEKYQRYKNIFELSPETILFVNRSGKLLDINEQVYKLMGYKREDLVGKSILRLPFLTRSAVTTIGKNFALRMLGRHIPPYEVELKTKKGEIRIGTITATPIRNEKGKITGEVVVAHDITERVKAEERFKTIFELAPDGMVVFDLEGRITDVNNAILNMLELTRDEMIGKKFTEFKVFYKKDIPKLKKIFDQAVSGNIPEEYEIEMTTKSKKKVLASVRNGLLKVGEKPYAVQILVRDITKEKEADFLLKQEQEKAQNYLDLAGAIIMALDKKGEVTMINNKGAELLGYSVKEIDGKNWFENFVPAKIRADLKKKHIQGLNNPDKYETLFPEGYKNAVLTKDGQTKEIRWHNTLLKDEKGDVIGSLSSGEDVTLSEAAMAEIEKRNTQLKRLNKVMIGREIRIIDLKKKNKQLQEKLNK